MYDWTYKDADGKHCFIWYGDNVRNVLGKESPSLSGEDFVILVNHPKMKFGELDFDLAPFFQGLPEIYPRMSFYKKVSWYLKKFACKQISTLRFECTLFAGPYEDDIENNAFIDGIWNLIHPEVLEYIKFRNWAFDMRLPDCKHHPCLLPSKRLKEDKFKNARYLDIQNFGFLVDWKAYKTFSHIDIAHLKEDQILAIVTDFRSCGPVTIRTRYRIDVEGAKQYLTRSLPSHCKLNFAGNPLTIIDGLSNVVVEFEDYQLRVTANWLSPEYLQQ